jgi:hypothetical protein
MKNEDPMQVTHRVNREQSFHRRQHNPIHHKKEVPRRICAISDDLLHLNIEDYMPTIYDFSSGSSSTKALRLACTRSCRLSRAALVFARLASISSLSTLSRCFSALALWIYK